MALWTNTPDSCTASRACSGVNEPASSKSTPSKPACAASLSRSTSVRSLPSRLLGDHAQLAGEQDPLAGRRDDDRRGFSWAADAFADNATAEAVTPAASKERRVTLLVTWDMVGLRWRGSKLAALPSISA